MMQLIESESLNLKPLVPHHGDYDMIQITPMRPNLTYQNHFDGALVTKILPMEKYQEGFEMVKSHHVMKVLL
jgi:hypothetical protein